MSDPTAWGAVPIEAPAPPPPTPGADAPAADSPVAWGAKPIAQTEDAGIYGSFLAGFASDEKETVRMLADRLFPNEPIEQAVKRFSKDKSGAILYENEQGQKFPALPTGGVRGAAASIAKGAGPALPIGAAAATGILTAPMALGGPPGLAASVGLTAGAGAGGEVVRQKVGDALIGDRASDKSLNVGSVIREGAESGLGQGIGTAATALANRRVAGDIARFNPSQTAQNYSEAQRVGVSLTPAEATGVPSLASQQKWMTNSPATQDKMRAFLDNRNTEVRNAWDDLLTGISRKADGEDVGIAARDAASGALTKLRKEAQAAAEPFYKAAYEKKIPHTEKMAEFLERPTMQRVYARALEIAEDSKEPSIVKLVTKDPDTGRFMVAEKPDVRQWDHMKRSIDTLIEDHTDALGKVSWDGRRFVQLKRELLDFFDNPKSKSYVPEYKQARQLYGTGAEDYTNALESAVGTLAKTKDTNVLSAARQIFNPQTRSPKMVADIRNLLTKENPDAWQAVKRLWLDDVAQGAMRAVEGGDVVNPAGKIVKAFADEKTRHIIRTAMSPQEWQDFNKLIAVFRNASSVPALRSDTAFNLMIEKEREKATKPLLSSAVGAVKALNPVSENFLGLKSLQNWLHDRNMDKLAQRTVDIVTSGDPEAIRLMRELRQLTPGNTRWLATVGHLLERGSGAAIGAAVADEADQQDQRNGRQASE
jgi:hypothetical protein